MEEIPNYPHTHYRACEAETVEAETDWAKAFDAYRASLLADEDWRAAVVRMSGKGIAALQAAPEAMEMFDMHVVSTGRSGEIRNRSHYAEYFFNWWRCMKFRSAAEIEMANRQPDIAPGTGRSAPPQKKSRMQQAVELGNAVNENVRKMMLGYE